MSIAQEIREEAHRADALVSEGRSALRRAIGTARRAGFTQTEIATLVGRSQPEVARHLRQLDRTWQTIPEIAAMVGDLLADDSPGDALRFLLDGIVRLRSLRRRGDVTDFLTAPASTGDLRWDTLIAAATAHQCRALGMTPPRWTRRTTLPSWWWPAGETVLRARTMQRTPSELRRVGIWLDVANFETA